MNNFSQRALKRHLALHGKISINLKGSFDEPDALSIFYTPGVGAVSSHVAAHKEDLPKYTWTGNNVAVVSDGSAVLGLGNIGPEGALPVMEGKSMLFKHFADIDAVPIVLNVHTADEIVKTVEAIAPSFGGINLEDIAAPLCFEVEDRLAENLPIPVFHDDQHGTAVVVLAGLINAMKVTNRKLKDTKVVLVGAGAAGVAISKLLTIYAPGISILAIDSKGIISRNRKDLNASKAALLSFTNPDNVSGELKDALRGADIFIGVSQPKLLNSDLIQEMHTDPIIFALANPEPEIYPNEAKDAGAAIVATGRSDFPNQVNNALAFPGIFRGALDHKVRQITDEHKIAAAEAIAGLVPDPAADKIIPHVTANGLVEAVAAVITA